MKNRSNITSRNMDVNQSILNACGKLLKKLEKIDNTNLIINTSTITKSR